MYDPRSEQSLRRKLLRRRRWLSSSMIASMMLMWTRFPAVSTTNAFATRRRIPIQKEQQKLPRIATVIQSASSNADTMDRSSSKTRGMTIALASSYFTVMGAKCALPSVLSLLLSPEIGLRFPLGSSPPQQQMARLLTVSTLSVALGKLVLGPLIDRFGGKRSLQVALALLSLSLLLISICQSFVVFGVAWIIIDFIFSSCWPACINTIHQYFDEVDWPSQIGHLATAARAGNSLAFVIFSTIIAFTERLGAIRQCWRPVFFVASATQLIPILLLSTFGGSGGDRSVQNSSRAVTIEASISTLRREIKTLDFWLHLLNRSMLMIVASFLLFVPTLMTQVYQTTNAVGAQVGSLYALGCLAAVTTLSKPFARMRKPIKLRSITALLLFGGTGSSLLQLTHVSGLVHLSPLFSALLMFIWGFSFAIPFYVPPSMYALSRGGKESSATITDVFDIGGFGLLAAFNGYVASIQHDRISAWIPTFIITSSCTFISFLALFLVTVRDDYRQVSG